MAQSRARRAPQVPRPSECRARPAWRRPPAPGRRGEGGGAGGPGDPEGRGPAGVPFPRRSCAAFLVIKLRSGWRLLDGGALQSDWFSLRPALPPGARLSPALPIVLPPDATPSAAERELARFLHLHLAPGTDAAAALALARRWSFVERAECAD